MAVHLHPTAYGRAAHQALHRVICAAKTGDRMAPVTLLVPTNLCGTLARRALAAMSTGSGATGIAALNVLTVDRLAELLAAPVLVADGRRPTTGPVLSAAWRRVLADRPGLFEHVAQHPATVTALVAAHRQLRDLTAPALEAVGGTGRLTADVVRLHRVVTAALQQRWYDAADLRTTAAAQLPTSGQVAGLGTVVLFLPQDLPRTAADLVAALARHVDVSVVAGLTGDDRADAAVRATVQRVGGQLLPDPPRRRATATRVWHASDSDDEVRGVVRDVVEALRTTPASRVAVLYGAPVPYARLLHDHLSAAHVVVNGPGVRRTAERTLPRALLALLALAEHGVDRAGLLRLLAGAAVRTTTGGTAPTARWERISRRAGVVTAEDWEPRLLRYAQDERGRAQAESKREAPLPGIVERHERSASAADELRTFVRELQQRLAEGQRARGWSALSRWAMDTYEALLAGPAVLERLPEEDRRAAEVVERVLSGLAGLDALESEADLRALREVVELELADDLPRTGRSGTGVLVAPLSAALGLDADVVFVLGLAEGLTPARVHEDALLPDRAREAAQDQLPAVRERLDRQHRHLLAAFAAAPEVVATFPRGDLRRSGERLPSRWLLPSLRALTGRPDLAATCWQDEAAEALPGSRSYAASVRTRDDPATSQEWRLRALSAGTALPDEPVLDAARELLAARHSAHFTRYDGDLSDHAASLPRPGDGGTPVSPTALEHWVSCPHAYFLQRVLKVEPVEQPEELVTLSPADRGSLLHEALDAFFRELPHAPGPDQTWTEAQRERLRAAGETVADDYEARGLTGHPTLWARERRLLLDDLRLLLDEDERVRRAGRRRQVRSELTFGGRDVGQPVELRLPSGRLLRLAGSADRVDVCEDDSLVVVDYKAGKPDPFKGLSAEDPDKQGSKLQLPAYGYAARQALSRPDAEVRVEYWFIGPRGRGTRIGYPLTPEVEQRYAQVLDTVTDGITRGIFPANVPEDRPWSPFAACPYCDPDGLGAKERRVQWQRKKVAPELAPYLELIEPPDGEQV